MFLLKVIIILVYNTLKDQIALLSTFYGMSLTGAIITIGSIVIDLGMKISLVFSFLPMVYFLQLELDFLLLLLLFSVPINLLPLPLKLEHLMKFWHMSTV